MNRQWSVLRSSPAGPEMAMRFRAIAAGDGDIELGVAPHAVLVHVEAAFFDVRSEEHTSELQSQ